MSMLENFIALVILGAIFYGIVAFCKRDERIKAKEAQEQLEHFEKNEKRLKSSDDYNLIENFVEKYGYDGNIKPVYNFHKHFGRKVDNLADVFEPESHPFNPQYVDKIGDLTDLLSSKGYDFNENEVKVLIKEAYVQLRYETFRNKMLANKPSGIMDCVKNLLEIYGDDYETYMAEFKRLLREGGYSVSEGQLKEQINKIQKEMKLSRFEKRLVSSEPTYSIDDVDSMTGFEFEEFLKRLFENMGYRVEHTSFSGDQGADLVVDKHDEKTVVQAKRNASSIGNQAIQEVVASVNHYQADRALVITNSTFTRSAVALAESNNVELIDRSKLSEWIAEYL